MKRDSDPVLAELADAMTRGRCAHLSNVELRLALRFAKVTPAMIDGPPEGVIIGESPGPNTVGRRPLLPWPINASGDRLMRMAGITPGQYLGRFLRFNLFDAHVPDDQWSKEAAVVRANTIKSRLVSDGSWRALLLGQRVATAFGVDAPWTRVEEFHPTEDGGTTFAMVAIPHPSGLNRDYNDEKVRLAAGGAVQWVAGYV